MTAPIKEPAAPRSLAELYQAVLALIRALNMRLEALERRVKEE